MNESHINPINPINRVPIEPASLSVSERDQIARLMELHRPKAPEPFVIKPPIPPVVEDKSGQNPIVEPPLAIQVQQGLTKEQYDKIKNSEPIIPTEELKAKLYDTYVKQIAAERAEREPLPGTVEQALDPVPEFIEVTNTETKQKEIIKIRPMKAIDITIFKLTNSPLYSLMMGDIATDKEAITKLKIDEETMFDIIYQFLTDPREVYKNIKQGYPKFHEQAMELGFKYDPQDMMNIVSYVMSVISLGNSTRATFDGPKSTEALPDKKKQE